MPAGQGPDFVNAAFEIETDLGPEALLAHLHGVEARFGRERGVRWGARTLDLDLIAHGTAVLPDRATWMQWADLPEAERGTRAPDRLILPHPRLAERGFVLVPLAEIAPDWRHPVSDLSVREMVAALPEAERTGPRRLD